MMVMVDKIGFVVVVCLRLILEYDDQGVWMMNYARSKDGKCGVKTCEAAGEVLISYCSTFDEVMEMIIFCNNCCDYVIKRRPRVI